MDQASPEGVATPDVIGANVPQQPPAQDTAAKPTETRAESPPAVDEQPKEPKGVGKRIDELTRLRRDAERDRDHWRELAMRQQTPPQQQQTPQDDKPKSLKDFNYDERAYQDHLYGEARKHAEKAAREAGERWKAEQEAVARRAKFDERVAQFAKSVEDYSEVVTDSTPVSEGMADFLLDSDEAGALMYYLGNNPDEARKLYSLSPAKAGRELTKLEERLVAERKKAAEKPVSQAPPPPPKIEASTPSAGLKSTDPAAAELPGDQWRKLRDKELAALKKKRS